MALESIADEAEGRMGYWLRANSAVVLPKILNKSSVWEKHTWHFKLRSAKAC